MRRTQSLSHEGLSTRTRQTRTALPRYPSVLLMQCHVDASYEGGGIFGLTCFLNDGTPSPKIVGKYAPLIILHDDSRCTARPWDFNRVAVLFFFQNQIFLGEVLTSQIGEKLRKKRCTSIRSTRLLLSHPTAGVSRFRRERSRHSDWLSSSIFELSVSRSRFTSTMVVF